VHGLELLDALFEFFDVEGRRDPVAEVGQLGNVLADALRDTAGGL
jgi:hypothetical protein